MPTFRVYFWNFLGYSVKTLPFPAKFLTQASVIIFQVSLKNIWVEFSSFLYVLEQTDANWPRAKIQKSSEPEKQTESNQNAATTSSSADTSSANSIEAPAFTSKNQSPTNSKHDCDEADSENRLMIVESPAMFIMFYRGIYF